MVCSTVKIISVYLDVLCVHVHTSLGSASVLRKFAIANIFECRIRIYQHLSAHLCALPNLIKTARTDCSSNFFPSLLLTLINSSNAFFFFSSSSSACNFNFACCLRSISVRRFCADEVLLCDRVPRRAPKSLWPRLRSSTGFSLRREGAEASGGRVGFGDGGLLRRGRLGFGEGGSEGRLLVIGVGDGGGSGRTTAEGMVLHGYGLVMVYRRIDKRLR